MNQPEKGRSRGVLGEEADTQREGGRHLVDGGGLEGAGRGRWRSWSRAGARGAGVGSQQGWGKAEGKMASFGAWMLPWPWVGAHDGGGQREVWKKGQHTSSFQLSGTLASRRGKWKPDLAASTVQIY